MKVFVQAADGKTVCRRKIFGFYSPLVMSNQFNILRGLLIYGSCLVLAIFLGSLLATPESRDTLLVVALVFGVLALPLLMRWHHPLLVLSWNLCAVAFFLPGQLQVWMVVMVASLGVSVFQRALGRGMKFLPAGPVVWPLVFLGVVILGTAHFTGGISVRAAGSGTYGGKRYLVLMASILGFFALTCRHIPVTDAGRYVAMFILSGVTAAIANLVSVVNPSFYFIFLLFPPDLAAFEQAAVLTGDVVLRLGGVSTAASCIFFYLLARHGIRGLLGLRNWWRWLLLVLMLAVSLVGGFRSVFIAMSLTFAIVFCLEGLLRTRWLPIMGLGLTLLAAVTLPFMKQLPLPVQRTFSFLPVEVSPVAAADAQTSSEWRLKMWRLVLPEVPNYLLLGKGYGIKGDDLELAENLVASGRGDSAEVAMLAGDYHNGPLSVIIPLGIWGVLAFLWFLAAATWGLYRNYRHGESTLKFINTFLLAYFLMRVIMFFVVVGALNYDLFAFTGLVGMSISLNGGIVGPRRNSPVTAPPIKETSLDTRTVH
jgi:O-antigen ligase